MPTPETVYLNQYDMLVTRLEIVLGGVSMPLAPVHDVRVDSTSAYRGKSIPFVMGLGFVLWALVEVLNAPASYGWAGVAALLALLSFSAVRLVGDFQVHTVYLLTAKGETAVLQSRDGEAVSALVTAIRKAVATHQRDGAPQGWMPVSVANG